jgi:hypothetical protein
MNIRSRISRGRSLDGSLVVQTKAPKGAKADALDSVPVEREVSRSANTRLQDRHRLPEHQVRVTHRRNDHLVQLINLSGGGAMITGDFEPKLWDRVKLHVAEDGVLDCVVCWLKGDRIGLEFAHETRLDCSPDKQAQLLREVIANSFPDVEFHAEPAKPAEQAEQAEPAVPEDEHRGERRHPLIWSGTLHYDFSSTPVRLRNISERGALIESERTLPVGAEPLLDLGEAGSVFGTVSWSVGDQAGLSFHTPFDMTMLAKAKPELAPARWETPDYLKPGRGGSSPWADEWGRMSLGELRDELDGFLKR